MSTRLIKPSAWPRYFIYIVHTYRTYFEICPLTPVLLPTYSDCAVLFRPLSDSMLFFLIFYIPWIGDHLPSFYSFCSIEVFIAVSQHYLLSKFNLVFMYNVVVWCLRRQNQRHLPQVRRKYRHFGIPALFF